MFGSVCLVDRLDVEAAMSLKSALGSKAIHAARGPLPIQIQFKQLNFVGVLKQDVGEFTRAKIS